MAIGQWPIKAESEINRKSLRECSSPQPGDPRRCQAARRRRGDQCRRWASKTSLYCAFHRKLIRKKSVGGTTGSKMYVGFYKSQLNETLRTYLAEQECEEIRTLKEEVTIGRSVVLHYVKAFEKIVIEDKEKNFTPEQKALSINGVKEALSWISTLIEKDAKISALRSENLDKDQLQHLFVNVERLLRKKHGDKIADEVMETIIETKLPDNPEKEVSLIIS